MNAPAPHPLQAALAVSASMLDAAAAGDWDQVVALDGQRQPLLRAERIQRAEDVTWLRQLVEHNQQLMTLAGAAHARAGQALGQHGRAHRALAAYVALVD